MRGFFTFTLRVLYEIVILIVILILLVYAVQAVGLLSSFEDRKYIAMVKFIENSLKQLQLDQAETWGDYIIYNPVKYSIFFNYTDGRIYLYKCDSLELKVVFYNITNNLMAKDLDETICYPIYISREVLNDATIVNISGGVISEIKEGGKIEALPIKLYNLMYNEFCYPTSGESPEPYICLPGLFIKDIYDSIIISKGSELKDVSSYFFGSASINKGVEISNDCKDVNGYKKCIIDAKDLLKDGKLVMPKITVSINKTAQNTIINFRTTI